MSMKMRSFLPIGEMQSTASTLFAAYASLAASLMLFRSMFNDLIPEFLRSRVYSLFNYLFTPPSTQATIIIDELSGISRNHVYDAAEVYLSSKTGLSSDCFKVHKTLKQRNINIGVVKNDVIPDTYLNFNLQWKLASVETKDGNGREKKQFELTFDKKFKQVVVNGYLPYVLVRAKEIRENKRVVKLYTTNYGGSFDCDDDCGGGTWGAINLDHPSTFDTLAMEPQLKSAIIEDLERFLRRKDFYKKVGKAWKRGYLLYGPPGTGKSSLIAAMANYLKFDIYDLELTGLYSNQELRQILLSTTNRSIVVIEDIDCSVEMQDRRYQHEKSSHTKLTLSGLLNFSDGLWSSCGDERIIVFTTNHKDRLDPALLRPGRMDMHIHMSYCTMEGFKLLANNYLGVVDHHKLFPEIEGLIGEIEVTPAEIAEELMKWEDVDLALTGVINFLKGKKIEADQKKEVKVSGSEDADDNDDNVSEENGDSTELHETKMVKRRRNGRKGGYRIGYRGRGF